MRQSVKSSHWVEMSKSQKQSTRRMSLVARTPNPRAAKAHHKELGLGVIERNRWKLYYRQYLAAELIKKIENIKGSADVRDLERIRASISQGDMDVKIDAELGSSTSSGAKLAVSSSSQPSTVDLAIFASRAQKDELMKTHLFELDSQIQGVQIVTENDVDPDDQRKLRRLAAEKATHALRLDLDTECYYWTHLWGDLTRGKKNRSPWEAIKRLRDEACVRSQRKKGLQRNFGAALQELTSGNPKIQLGPHDLLSPVWTHATLQAPIRHEFWSYLESQLSLLLDLARPEERSDDSDDETGKDSRPDAEMSRRKEAFKNLETKAKDLQQEFKRIDAFFSLPANRVPLYTTFALVLDKAAAIFSRSLYLEPWPEMLMAAVKEANLHVLPVVNANNPHASSVPLDDESSKDAWTRQIEKAELEKDEPFIFWQKLQEQVLRNLGEEQNETQVPELVISDQGIEEVQSKHVSPESVDEHKPQRARVVLAEQKSRQGALKKSSAADEGEPIVVRLMNTPREALDDKKQEQWRTTKAQFLQILFFKMRYDLARLRALWRPEDWGDLEKAVDVIAAQEATTERDFSEPSSRRCQALAFRDELMVPCDNATEVTQTFCHHHSRSAWRAIAGTETRPATPLDNLRLLLKTRTSVGEATLEVSRRLLFNPKHLTALAFYDAAELNGLDKDALLDLAKQQGVLNDGELEKMQGLTKKAERLHFFVRRQEAAASALGFAVASAPRWAKNAPLEG